MESAANPSNVNLSNQEGENVLVGDVSREQENVVQAAKTELNVESPNHEGNEHAKGLKLALIALALCLGVFLVALGMFIFSLSFKPSEVGGSLPGLANTYSLTLQTTASLPRQFQRLQTNSTALTVSAGMEVVR